MSPSKKQPKNYHKPRYSKIKFLMTFILATIVFTAIRHFANIHVPLLAIDADKPTVSLNDDVVSEVYVGSYVEEIEYSPLDSTDLTPEEIEAREEQAEDSARIANEKTDEEIIEEEQEIAIEQEEIQDTDVPSEESTAQPSPEKPLKRRHPHRVRGVYSWDKCFPDINDTQLVAARKNGIRPAKNRDAVKKLIAEHKLVNITNSPYYTVDDLTHSMPYLVPKAQHLLNTICINFIDSLQMKGLPIHLPMVTSVLRTTDDVTKLQKGNGNATTHSCHCYGTTVDITYNRFVPITGTYDPHSPLLRWDFQMKQVLAEVLDDLRQQGLCYVKYEKKQACFHLTVR